MSTQQQTSPHINQVRQHLLDTLTDLRCRQNPMDPDRARAIAQVAGVLVDTAKVEVEFIKVAGTDKSEFLEAPKTPHQGQLESGYTGGDVERIGDVTRHRMRG